MPTPWSEGEKIPWNEPGFSERMLVHHLSQDHDHASRRYQIIDRQVEWIHNHVLEGRLSRVIDLTCGPGFYTGRLTRLGHRCKGIDFGPASIEYAKERAKENGLDIEYVLEDVRTAKYGSGYDLAMMIYGEFNVFKVEDIKLILGKAYDSLSEGGVFIAEPNRFELVRGEGESPPSWYSSRSGLFSPRPHLCLVENFWDEKDHVATTRYFIVDSETAEVTLHASSMMAYTREDYGRLLEGAGFRDIEFHESLTGDSVELNTNLEVILARK